MNLQSKNVLIFTDLDGTLLDYRDYSFNKAAPLVSKLKKIGAIIVFCSSKTRAEQEVYRRQLDLNSPFISENGGAIFIDKDYFSFNYKYTKFDSDYRVIEMGMPYEKIRNRLDKIRKTNNLTFMGFGDMNVTEVAEITGLDQVSAELAKKREYSETLNIIGSKKDIDFTLKQIEIAGLKCVKGTRFYSIFSRSDKGKAVRVLSELFKREFGLVNTIGVGDSPNDFSMLAEVDVPVLVQKISGIWEDVDLPNLYKAEGIGPDGWVNALRYLMRV